MCEMHHKPSPKSPMPIVGEYGALQFLGDRIGSHSLSRGFVDALASDAALSPWPLGRGLGPASSQIQWCKGSGSRDFGPCTMDGDALGPSGLP